MAKIRKGVSLQPVTERVVREPDRMTVSVGMTVSLGNFEFVRADVSMSSSREEDESSKKLYRRVKSEARMFLDNLATEMVKDHKE